MQTNPSATTSRLHAPPADTATSTDTTGDHDHAPATDQSRGVNRADRASAWARAHDLVVSVVLGVVMAGTIALLTGTLHSPAASTNNASGGLALGTSPQVHPVAFTTALVASTEQPRSMPISLATLAFQQRGGCGRTELDSHPDLGDRPGVVVQAGPLGISVGLQDSAPARCDHSDRTGRAALTSPSSRHTAKHCGERARDCAPDCTCHDHDPSWAPSSWNDDWGNAPAQHSTYPNSQAPAYGYPYGVPNGAASGYGPGYPNGYGPANGSYAPGYPPPGASGPAGVCRYFYPGDSRDLPRGGVVCTPTGP